MTRRDRRVGGEGVPRARQFERLPEGEVVGLHERPNPFEGEECGMPLVHVADGGPDIHVMKRPKAPDAEERGRHAAADRGPLQVGVHGDDAEEEGDGAHVVGVEPVGEGDQILRRKFPQRWWLTD